MAEAISVAASVLGMVGLANQVLSESYVLLVKAYRSNYANARFASGWKRLLRYFVSFDEIQNLHWDINCWEDDEVKAWKDNTLSGYGAVAIAVRMSTIFA